MRIQLTVNGTEYERDVEPRLLLSDFLRHSLDLTGTRVGCEHGVCGACTVLMNGEAIRSCLVLAVQAHGQALTTVEGLAGAGAAAADGQTASGTHTTPATPAAPALHPLQTAFHEKHGLQCGFCTPGMLMTLIPFLEENPDPTEHEIREAITGNLCRCTGYENIVRAVRHVAERNGG